MKDFLVKRLEDLKKHREQCILTFNEMNGRIAETEQMIHVLDQEKVEEVSTEIGEGEAVETATTDEVAA